MADQENPVSDASAEKAYAAASQAVPVRLEPEAAVKVAEAPSSPPAVEFPAKAKRAKPVVKASEPVVQAAAPSPPVVKPAIVEPVAAKPAPVKAAVAKPAPIKSAPVTAATPEPVVPKPPLAKVRKPIKPAAAKPAPIKRVPAPRPVAAKAKVAAKPTLAFTAKSPTDVQPKDKTMATSPQLTETLQKTAAETQAKAKQVFEKGTAFLGDYAEFAKGNVSAVVESGKILASGVKTLGTGLVAETKTAFETATADAKQLAAVKAPSDLFTLQSEILRRNFDSAVALSTKHSEALIKLASDSFAPLSGRFTLAVEKIKSAA